MRKIRVNGLFGKFDYDINLKTDGLTILTGPNGYGKSTILRIISNLTKGIFGFLQIMNTKFSTIEIIFDDGSKYEIVNSKDKFEINGKDIKKNILKIAEQLFERRVFRTADNEMIYDRRNDRYFKSDKIIQYLAEEIDEGFTDDRFVADYFQKIITNHRETNSIITEIQDKIGQLYFIREQRLIQSKRSEDYRNRKETIDVITEIPVKLRQIILDVASQYSQVSTRIDSSYPSRLLRNETTINEKQFLSKNEEIKKKYNKLREYDLTPEQPVDEMQYKEEFSKALSVYFEDFNEKYGVYAPLIEQLDLYTDIINHRLSFKKVIISKEDGLSVVNDKDEAIGLIQLSSGEQQEIVLFYELIFGTLDSSILLIDEPEISLHIAWQRMFTDDLIRIANYKNFDVIIATHSPQIINNRWENQIDLGELYELNKK